jgi:hypothetical protein
MDLSVIVVNWNTKDLLRDCLRSVYQTVSDLSYEVIVVDNASRDGSAAMVEEEFPLATVVRNEENLGFGAANNQAFRIMQGRYALLLNSDAVLAPDAARTLFSFMESRPEAAMAVCQFLNADGSKQHSVASFPSLLTCLTNMPLLEYLFPRRFPSKRHDYSEPIEVDSGLGACLMVRKALIDEVGMFDERYYFFFEETDWAKQMRNAGWKVYFVPSAFAYHRQGQSIGRDIRSRIEFYRSRYQYFRKWNSRFTYVVIACVLFGRLIINWFLTSAANLLLLGMRREMRNKWVVYSQLILWHLKGCPRPS